MLVVFQSLAGGMFALAGVALLWALQRHTRNEDQGQKKTDLRREKAEEIYREMEVLKTELVQATANAAKILDRPAEPVQNTIVAPGRLRGLVAIYFPDANEFFADHDAKVAEHGQWLRSQFKTPAGKFTDPETMRGLTFGHANLLNLEMLHLLDRLRRYMDEQAKSLL